MKRGRLVIALLLFTIAFRLSAQQQPLLTDEFNDNSIDAALWDVSLPYLNAPRSSATETNGSLSLFRRGVLDADGTFDGALDIQGKFRFTGEGDALSVVFRSDLTVTNQFERRGVQVALQQTSGRVFIIPEPFASTPTSGVFLIAKNQDVTFRVTDNGSLVRLYLDDLFTPLLSTTVTNRRGNRISLYNFAGTAARSEVDAFSVHRLRTTVFIDDKLMREGVVRKATPVQVKFQSYYTNRNIYYTLDGSAPSFISAEYTQPFNVPESATVRAVSYRSDFLESVESPAIEVVIAPEVTLTNQTPGGGIVQFDPPGPTYPSNSTVSLTALPGPGWQFLRWEGAAGGTTTNVVVAMTNHLSVRAVFGTAPAISVIGGGQVQTYPTGAVHAYGTRLRLMGVPTTGNYFFRWAGAFTGNASPATLLVTNATPAVTGLFSPLAGNQAALVALVDGPGTISLSPAVNVFTNGQSVTLTALPDTNQIFLGWSGDATGTTNPLTLLFGGNKTLTARFAPAIKFKTSSSVFDTNGFLLSMEGVPGFVFDLQASSNLADWFVVAPLTNTSGTLLHQHREATNHPSLFYRVVAP